MLAVIVIERRCAAFSNKPPVAREVVNDLAVRYVGVRTDSVEIEVEEIEVVGGGEGKWERRRHG